MTVDPATDGQHVRVILYRRRKAWPICAVQPADGWNHLIASPHDARLKAQVRHGIKGYARTALLLLRRAKLAATAARRAVLARARRADRRGPAFRESQRLCRSW